MAARVRGSGSKDEREWQQGSEGVAARARGSGSKVHGAGMDSPAEKMTTGTLSSCRGGEGYGYNWDVTALVRVKSSQSGYSA